MMIGLSVSCFFLFRLPGEAALELVRLVLGPWRSKRLGPRLRPASRERFVGDLYGGVRRLANDLC